MIPLIKDKKVSEYTSAYSSTLWLFENVEKQEYLSHLEEIEANGYKEAYKTDIEDNYKIVCATYKDDEIYLDEVLGEDKLKSILPMFVKE